MKIEEEIKQKVFKDEYHKAHINVLYTASWFSQQSNQILRPYNISWQQFNILRILRGMHPRPASVKILADRMIDKMSNASRLVEKLKQKGLVVRRSCDQDRRRVDVKITGEGLEMLEEVSVLMDKNLEISMAGISVEEALQLNLILDKLRG